MNEDNRQEVLNLMNEWYIQENIPEDVMQARVVLIFKKGDKEDLANYRPISLLNTFYKILAAIIQYRISIGIDKYLQKTEYGFRGNRGTAEAIHFVRRMVEKGESRQSNTHLVLFDREKAFDKIEHEKLFEALQRMNVPEKTIIMITLFYNNAQFCISMDGKNSKWYMQQAGIRQGCPLSPYLFLIVMTVLFDDIHHNDKLKMKNRE